VPGEKNIYSDNAVAVSMLQDKCLLVVCKLYKTLWLFIKKKGFIYVLCNTLIFVSC